MHKLVEFARVACVLVLAALSALSAGCNQIEAVPGMQRLPPQLAPFARKIADSKLPHVNVIPIVEPTTIWDSKIRGVPYYPKDHPWPSDPEGTPLVMFVQINFEEMPRLEGYPTEGILQLYISAGYDPDKQMWGMRNDNKHPTERERLTDQTYFRAVYFEKVSRDIEELINETPEVEFDEEYGFPAEAEARLQFTLGSSYVRPDDYRFRRVFGRDSGEFFDYRSPGMRELEEAYEKFLGDLYYGARIGGYARSEQADPRLELPDEDWILLFSLDDVGGTYPAAWAGGGIGNFFIRSADLAKRDFGRVMFHWSF